MGWARVLTCGRILSRRLQVPKRKSMFSSTAATEAHVLQEYGDFADDYESTLQAYGYVVDKLGPQLVEDELVSLEASGISVTLPWRVLDLGCGTGNTAVLYFGKPGRYTVVGVDLTPEMVAKAGQRPYEKLI